MMKEISKNTEQRIERSKGTVFSSMADITNPIIMQFFSKNRVGLRITGYIFSMKIEISKHTIGTPLSIFRTRVIKNRVTK